MSVARVSALNVYPLKGARGIAVARAQVDVTGLATLGAGDREWMVVDGEGRFVTQREQPTLALVEASVVDGTLVIRIPDGRSVALPLDPPAGAMREVTVWRSHVRGFDAGDEAARLLSAHLGRELRVVRFDPSKPRMCNPDFVGRSRAHTRYADGYPVLVIGQSSLDELNDRLEAKGSQPLPMNRFRPNVVVEGLEPFEEDHVDTLDCGGVVLRMVKPCTRCQVTTTDQASAAVGLEPLRTLSEYRRDARLEGVTFGMNAIVVAGGTLAAGSDATFTLAF